MTELEDDASYCGTDLDLNLNLDDDADAPRKEDEIFHILDMMKNNEKLSQSQHQTILSINFSLQKYIQEEIGVADIVMRYEDIDSLLKISKDLIFLNLCLKTSGTIEESQSSRHDTIQIICSLIKTRSKELSETATDCDLMQCGRILTSSNRTIHGIVALYACARMNKLRGLGDASVDNIQKCAWMLTFSFDKLAGDNRFSELAVNCFIPFLTTELTKFIRSVRTSCHKFRTENEAWCLLRMGLCYSSFGDYKKYAMTCEEAVHILRRRFKKDARTHQVYGTCLGNAAAAYIECREAEKSKELLSRSREAFDYARDCSVRDKEYALYILNYNENIVIISREDIPLETEL